MKKLKIAALVIVVGLVLFVLGGFLIEPHVELDTEARLKAPPAKVFATINTFDGEVVWWTAAMEQHVAEGMAPVDIIHAGGPKAGAGMMINFAQGDMVAEKWRFLESHEPDKVVIEVDFRLFVVKRTLTLLPDGTGTLVKWHETADIANPVARYFTVIMPPEDAIANFDGALKSLDQVTSKP